MANDIELIERVDPEEEQRAKREEKVLRRKEKMTKKKELQKRRKRNKKEEDGEDSDSSEELGGQDAAEKKALAFRRLQVQIKIEEFLKSYTRGQNLVKINARGKRYARRVYVDTAKRALVIQGANGPEDLPLCSNERGGSWDANHQGRPDWNLADLCHWEGRTHCEGADSCIPWPSKGQYLCELRHAIFSGTSENTIWLSWRSTSHDKLGISLTPNFFDDHVPFEWSWISPRHPCRKAGRCTGIAGMC